MAMNSIEATEMLTNISEMLNSPALAEYMKTTDANYSTDCWFILADVQFVLGDLLREFDPAA